MKKEKKVRKHTEKVSFIDIILIVACFLAVCFSATMFYGNVYLEKFYVSGQSMWPTLNENALDANGAVIGQEGGNLSGQVNTRVEVGLMDTHKGAKKRIKRFDVVATYYPDDIDDDEKALKIKRVIGLPGETLRFSREGDLYVNGSFVEQPISSELIKSGSNYTTRDITLKNNEYYVLGDNRGHSSDSRDLSVGPISKDLIYGKVIAIIGTGLVTSKDGENDIRKRDMDYYFWPRFKL